MKNILDTYSRYKIMPTLQLHQFRVAAVAKRICDSVSKPIDKDGVVWVSLLHDMGNIIKFDLSYFPEFLQPEGLEYWQNVKDEYIQKYGPEEHVATEMICEELGLSDIQKSYLNLVGFSKTKKALAGDLLEQKICCYADMRVGPHGVLTVEDRLADGRKRYEGRKDKAVASEQFEEYASALRELENQIFSQTTILPIDITDQSIEPIIGELRSL
ncbi:HD domain-containing protein [Candidatus Parcubacteria bacterium]|nr:HD domain-containing protein [Candidatus Parcubacteria bacterium]